MNKAKARGTAAEVAVRDFLQANGFPYCERLASAGGKDCGDLTGIPGAVIEVKNHKTMDLGGWFTELEAEMRNAAAHIGAVVHKRRGKGNPADWYVSMSGRVFAELLRAWAQQ